jgi:hypothetical protein
MLRHSKRPNALTAAMATSRATTRIAENFVFHWSMGFLSDERRIGGDNPSPDWGWASPEGVKSGRGILNPSFE